MSFSIRAAHLDDAGLLAQVHVDGWRWGYRGVLPDAFLDSLSIEARAERWRAILARGAARERNWIAMDQLGCAGFASTGPGRDAPEGVGELYAIYVAHRVVGTGLARALLARAVDELRTLGDHRAFLWVLEQNPRARRFYEREGWRADGSAKSDVIGGALVTELRYSIELC